MRRYILLENCKEKAEDELSQVRDAINEAEVQKYTSIQQLADVTFDVQKARDEKSKIEDEIALVTKEFEKLKLLLDKKQYARKQRENTATTFETLKGI